MLLEVTLKLIKFFEIVPLKDHGTNIMRMSFNLAYPQRFNNLSTYFHIGFELFHI